VGRIKLLDKKEGKQISFAEARGDVEERALWEKRNEVLEDWVEKAKADIKIEVHKELLGVAKSDSAKAGS
jgi:parvulin-like peptidyl-prolyl isomerase